MSGKKYAGVITAICLSLLTVGCGEKFPEMTQDEYDHTVEYAAGLLMRYSNNGQERLIYVDAKEVEKQRKKDAEKEAKKAEEESKKKPAPAPAPTPEPEPVQPQNTEDTNAEDSQNIGDATGAEQTAEASDSENTADQAGTENPEDSVLAGATVLSADESQEIMDSIFLSYQGYSISSTYPESSKSFVVNADKGKKLLVLRFDLYNGSDSVKSVNMIPLNLTSQIVLNGRNLGYSAVTFLPNDLASYAGNIDSRAHESVVILTQISESEATSIESLGMVISIKGQSQNVILK